MQTICMKINVPKMHFSTDGNWGDWASWGSCSVTCGNGTQIRIRNCNNPSPGPGGVSCVGSSSENHDCSNTYSCRQGKMFFNIRNLQAWTLNF